MAIIDSFSKAHSVICSGRYERILCAVSGGSDSDIVVDIITRFDKDGIVEYAYFDTGLEYKATKEHLGYLERKYDIQIMRIKAKYPVPLACKMVGQPFLSKLTSEYMMRLQLHGFKWEDKPYEELIKEYPDCQSALSWWCDRKDKDKPSMFNIKRNKYLKEFIISNPPTFKISPKCCELAKKKVSSDIDADYGLKIIGVRKYEGGARGGSNTCFAFGDKYDVYKPIFWFEQQDKAEYEEFANIEHSKCYTEYGLRRTGCAGCPFGRNFEYELEVLKEHEPLLYKAACNIFKDSYEYTRKYRAFCKAKDEEKKSTMIGYQYRLFDF